MSEYKSPYLVERQEFYFDTDIMPFEISEEAEMQRKVVLRAARIRKQSPRNLLWEYTINSIFWGLIFAGAYWLWRLL